MPTSMLILRVDLAFQAGDVWTVVDSPLSVAVFSTFTDVAHLGDHNCLNLNRDDVSPAFMLAVLSNRVKDWLTPLTVAFVKFFPQSGPLKSVACSLDLGGASVEGAR